MNKNSGVSLMSLIITIIVIIILASIAMFSNMNTPESASRSVFTEELSNLKVALAPYRADCFMVYDNENYGFKEVKLDGAPDKFISFSDSEDIGYVIDLEKIGYSSLKRGRDYDTVSDGATLKFKEDDVFVYDKNGTVFYVKGYMFEDKFYYTSTVYEEM